MLLRKHSNGSPDWGRPEWAALTPQRDLGQCLLTIVASFKRRKFRRDREWRLIFSPTISLSYSDPNIIDARFNSLIESEPVRHVSLQRENEFPPKNGTIWPFSYEKLEPYDDIVHLNAPTLREKIIAFAKGQ